MREQPIPAVVQSDVERVVRRDFPSEQFSEVIDLLNEYGIEQWQREQSRVQLAALKLAAGDLAKLRSVINDAKCDYRDVLMGAEYPGYAKKFSGKSKPSPDEREKVIDSDWKQYETWLRKKA